MNFITICTLLVHKMDRWPTSNVEWSCLTMGKFLLVFGMSWLLCGYFTDGKRGIYSVAQDPECPECKDFDCPMKTLLRACVSGSLKFCAFFPYYTVNLRVSLVLLTPSAYYGEKSSFWGTF